MKKKNVESYGMAGLFLIWLLFNGILLVLHEPWRDEANVWLMARELSPLQLFREIKYQGHPCLWYLLMMPFAKLGFPFRTIEVLSFLIMAAAAGIFWWQGTLNRVVKVLCLFSPIFTYFYPVIARNYCLIALFLVLLAWQHPQRDGHCVRYGLMLGLLVQADTIAIPIAGLISAMWLMKALWRCWKTKTFEPVKKILGGIWIPAASLILWFLQFYQVSDSPQFQIQDMGAGEMLREIRNFSYVILIRLTGSGQIFCRIFFICALAVFFVLSLKLKNGWAMTVLVGTFLFQAAFSALVYQLHIWHYISLGFVWIWAVWILWKQIREKGLSDLLVKGAFGTATGLLALLSVLMMVHWNSKEEPSSLKNALNGVYSDGGNTAAFIRENISPEELIVSDNVPMASTILAYLKDYDFYYAGNGQKESYADWSEDQSRSVSYVEVLDWVRNTFPEKEEFFIIQSRESCIQDGEALEECEVLYQSECSTVRDEEYRIMKVKL